jgi:holo-[acyl-carrier protein] synthase
VGVDLVRVADIAGSIARFGERYTARIFTDAERRYCIEDGRQAAQRFAARFAAKEATMKVLRPSNDDGVAWRSIEVCQLPEGACEITLSDAALALATRHGIAELSLSMSHEPEYATATVVAQIAVSGNA